MGTCTHRLFCYAQCITKRGGCVGRFQNLRSKTCPTHRRLHMQRKIYTTEFGGKTLTAEFNDLTAEANGSVMVRYGETVILVTAVMGKNDNAGLPYFPLSVELKKSFMPPVKFWAVELCGAKESQVMKRCSQPASSTEPFVRFFHLTSRLMSR